ncbi:hypothetical protein CS059_05595 [Porphyromonas gingivalis]|nr:hypothetical protein CS059_05595 [Porphyromonas gingivalis]
MAFSYVELTLKKTFARQLACKGLFISVQTLKNQSIDNEISRKMPCDSLIYRFNSSHGISHSPNLPSDTELMASSINRP